MNSELMQEKYNQILVDCMSKRAWGWHYLTVTSDHRPLLINAFSDVLIYPGLVGEDFDALKEEALQAWSHEKPEHKSLNQLILCLDGEPSDEYFAQAWQWTYKQRHIGSVDWCDMETSIKWNHQINALFEEQIEGAVVAEAIARSIRALCDRPLSFAKA